MFNKKIISQFLFFIVSINFVSLYTSDNSLREQFKNTLLQNPINVETVENILAKECFYKNGMKVGCYNSTLVNELYPFYGEGYKSALIHEAIHRNNAMRLIKLLIHYGADLNIKSDDGDIALHSAVAWNDQDIVRFLINAGADLNIRDDQGLMAEQITVGNFGNNETEYQAIIQEMHIIFAQARRAEKMKIFEN